MERKDNQGYIVEKKMMKLFKGKEHPDDCVDFQTNEVLYEVKSCKLILQQNKKGCLSTQLGRFHIKLWNHKGLKETAEREKKIPKYIFAITIGRQSIWKEMSWKRVDKILPSGQYSVPLKIHKVFKRELRLK